MMSLSRKHYRRIAAHLYHADVRYRTPPQKQAIEYLRTALIEMFADDNPRFDEKVFRHASSARSDA